MGLYADLASSTRVARSKLELSPADARSGLVSVGVGGVVGGFADRCLTKPKMRSQGWAWQQAVSSFGGDSAKGLHDSLSR